MLNKTAFQFFLLSQTLDSLHYSHGMPLSGYPTVRPVNYQETLVAAVAKIGQPVHPTTPEVGEGWDRSLREYRAALMSTFASIEIACKLIGIDSVIKDIRRAMDYFGTELELNRVRFHIEHITSRIKDELENQLFLQVQFRNWKYYKPIDLFGPEVGKKFPRATEDIANAGSCFALGQHTACVFHLMRAMEHCVQRFGKRLKISLDPMRSSWSEIMDQVNTHAKTLPGGKKATTAQNKRKQRFAMAAGRLDHVRIVWRNDVMHPKATYEETEASEVLAGVEAFFRSVVVLL